MKPRQINIGELLRLSIKVGDVFYDRSIDTEVEIRDERIDTLSDDVNMFRLYMVVWTKDGVRSDVHWFCEDIVKDFILHMKWVRKSAFIPEDWAHWMSWIRLNWRG